MSTRSVPTLKSLRARRELQRIRSANTLDVPKTSPLGGGGDKDEGLEDDQNPLYKASRWVLAARVTAIRSGAYLGFSIFHYSDPKAPPPSETIWVDATLGRWAAPRAISVDVFDPVPKSQLKKKVPGGSRLAVINFHGGGFILGSGTDDRHWVGALNASLDAVVFSINYRLAPSYPFPTAVEDCADAVQQICARADEFRFDRVVLSGFSAGGTLAVASWALLNSPESWGYELSRPVPPVDGLALFYPGLDWSIPRWRKRQDCAQPGLALPSSLTDLIDASYIYPRRGVAGRRDARMSPALMPDELAARLPPLHLCLCEHDMLRDEAERFASRLRRLGREVTTRVVGGERHAWDKPPPMSQKPSAAVEYTAAIAYIKGWLGQQGGDGGDGDVPSETEALEKEKEMPNNLEVPNINIVAC